MCLNRPFGLRLIAPAVLLLMQQTTWSGPAFPQSSARTLTGQVLDRQHEPLRGAIVQVQQEGTSNVISYITDRNGSFSFKRLSDGVDYKISASFRGKTCHAKELSHFDSKRDKNLVFVIKLD